MSTDTNLLTHPPFRPMRWDADGNWDGYIDLASNGMVGLTVTPTDPEVSRTPSPAQGVAYTFQLDNSPRIVESILTALLPHYQKMRPKYRDFLGAEFESLMPAVRSASDLASHIDLRQVYIHSWTKEGCAYVGWLFGCTWDAEHGLGAMLHRDRVVEIGSADVSFAWAPKEAEVQS
jgi:hypothetical protein